MPDTVEKQLYDALEGMLGKYHILLKHRQVLPRCQDKQCQDALAALRASEEETFRDSEERHG